MTKYINPPPKLASLPAFIMRRYDFFDKAFIEKLIVWSIKEYYDTIVHLYSTKQFALAKKLESEFSHVDFLARTNAFKTIEQNMKEGIWKSLTSEMKIVMIQGRNILRENKKNE